MSDFAQLAAKAKEDGAAAAAAPVDTTSETAAPASAAADEGAGAAAEEESTAQFEPVVQLEEVEVKTHEEDEEVLWKMRAKLFIFGETLLNKGTGQKEWVERGIGEVKFLQHKVNRFVRVLMRQEKTMKVICNHVADPRIVLKPNAGSDRSWVWNAFDFTEGQLEEMTFALRFGNSDSANEFKEQFTAAQKVVEGLMAGEAPEPAAEAEETAPATEEEAAADPSTDAAADALQNLSVGTGAEEAAPAEKA
ncbi:unnamed protein product [Ectocarpus sp. CCAP 1310/34]|nr:unnamed protein product [Ectocarpus sp. CCAP 1310/34]